METNLAEGYFYSSRPMIFWRDYNKMLARGVTFVRKPRVDSYGTVAVFQDLYGNLWDLLEWNSEYSPQE